MSFWFGVFALLVVTAWVMLILLGRTNVTNKIEEWKGTSKNLVWTLVWAIIYFSMIIVYFIAVFVLIALPIQAYNRESFSTFLVASCIVGIYMAIVLTPPRLIITNRIWKKYGMDEKEKKEKKLIENLRNRTRGEGSPLPPRQYLAEASKDAVPPKPKKSLSEIAAEAEAERGNNSTTNPWDKYNSE